jgi:hypothetical protein
MNEVQAYPLAWPTGWKRTAHRTAADFGTVQLLEGQTWKRKRELTIAEATGRVLDELRRMRVAQRDVIISTNLRLRNDGLPLSKQREPEDPGVAVYWQLSGKGLVIAADCYTKIADNLAAVAATLDAMRSIKRHGGAAILERAFTGFAALPAPMTGQKPWRDVLGVAFDERDRKRIEECYRIRRGEAHPDRQGGNHDSFLAVQTAYEQAARELGFTP